MTCLLKAYFLLFLPDTTIRGPTVKKPYMPNMPTGYTSGGYSINILGTLQQRCKKNCGVNFNIQQQDKMVLHENQCIGPEKYFRLLDILNVSQDKEIPKDVEKSCLSRSKTKNGQFQ